MAEDAKTTADLGLSESKANSGLFDKKEHHDKDTPADGPLFQDIDGDQEVTEIESLCMNCHENVWRQCSFLSATPCCSAVMPLKSTAMFSYALSSFTLTNETIGNDPPLVDPCAPLPGGHHHGL